jgi:hypothetical protein
MWKIENLSEQQHVSTIRDDDIIVSGTGEGRIPFVSVEDIADVAYHALTDPATHNTAHLILGPELYSYDEVSSQPSHQVWKVITVLTKVVDCRIAIPVSRKKSYACEGHGRTNCKRHDEVWS